MFGVRSVLWVKTNHGTANGQLPGSRNVLELDAADGCTTCEYTQNHRIVHLTWMNFMACLGPGSWKGAGLMGVSSGPGGEGQHLGWKMSDRLRGLRGDRVVVSPAPR